MTHKLFVLPNLLSQQASVDRYLPKEINEIACSLVGIVGEGKKDTIQYLKKLGVDVHKLDILLLNEHTTAEELREIQEKIKNKQGNWGLVSDAGMPIIADPGAKLIQFAKKEKIKIEILPGPSSILFALIQSGLSGQSFTFHGYFPYEEVDIKNLIKQIIPQIHQGYSQVFIETPYRNDKRIKELLGLLPDDISLTVAVNLTGGDEAVHTYPVRQWKHMTMEIGKNPAVFVIGKQSH